LERPRPPGPRHIVVFHAAWDGNSGLLSHVLGVGGAAVGRVRSGVTLLRARGPDAPPARVYERLGVAVADLDDDQLHRLRRQERVAAVVPNERCLVPASHAGGHASARADDRQTGPEAATSPGHSWCLDMIGVPASHRPSGRDVTVAVLDTGVDLAHPDLAGRFRGSWKASSFVPHETAQDGHGHGTHCVGVVGGPRRSSSGTRYGVAPGARVLVGKVLSDAGSGFSDWILDGIDWAAESGARVISLSCISNRTAGHPCAVVYERVAENLLQGRPGALVLAPAGNASERPWYTRAVDNPAACPSLLAVAAVHRARRIASFSGRQMDDIGEVNISAPGVGVHSAWTGGGFRTLSGTSMAVPHVAGVAALYLQEDPTLSALDLRRALESRAQPLGDARDFGSGLVQARKDSAGESEAAER
jgi:subtilisin family serine protease